MTLTTQTLERKAEYQRYRRQLLREGVKLMVPAIGTSRRIQALMALGWFDREIANELGIRRQLVYQLKHNRRWVYRETAEKVDEVFERMCMKVPPPHPYRMRARNNSRKQGYHPPLAWDNIDDPDEEPQGTRWR